MAEILVNSQANSLQRKSWQRTHHSEMWIGGGREILDLTTVLGHGEGCCKKPTEMQALKGIVKCAGASMERGTREAAGTTLPECLSCP